MKDVIEFPLDRIAGSKNVKGKTTAEIVIFPGVRIERPAFYLSDRIVPASSRAGQRMPAKEVEVL